jgi:hypothetical protein
MNATRSTATARVSHRPAIPLRADQYRIGRTGAARAFDAAQADNGWLISCSRGDAESPGPYGCSPALMHHALEAASRRQIPVWNMAEALLCAGA